MTIQRETIRTSLVRFAKHNSADVQRHHELQESRAGTYNHAVTAALAADGDAKAFSEVFEDVFDAIREDQGGMAQELGCEVAARRGDNGEPVYRVPSGMSAARSILTRALERKIALREDDGSPRAYNAIRSDVLELARRSKKTDPTKQRQRKMVEYLSEMRAQARTLDADQLDELYERLTQAWKTVAGSPIKPKRRQVTKAPAKQPSRKRSAA